MRRRNDCGTAASSPPTSTSIGGNPRRRSAVLTRLGEKIAKESFRPLLISCPLWNGHAIHGWSTVKGLALGVGIVGGGVNISHRWIALIKFIRQGEIR